MSRVEEFGVVTPEADPHRERFVSHIGYITQELENRDIKYSVVGGVAIKAILNEPVEYERENGTTPDIDVLGLGPDQPEIMAAVEHFREQAKIDPTFPEVGLEPVSFGENNDKRFFSMHSGLRMSNGRSFLTYQAIEQEIPTESVATVNRNYGGVGIPTFSGETTLWRYFLRGGVAKPKDMEKIIRLGHYVGENESEQLSSEARGAHQEFLNKVQERYGIRLGLYSMFWKVDHSLDGSLSGMRGDIYDVWTRFFSG